MIAFAKIQIEMQPLAIGAILIALTYGIGHVSGAHFNPALSLAYLIRGRLTVKEAAVYMVAHVLAALAAAGVVWFFVSAKPNFQTLPPAQSLPVLQAFVAEVLGTFGFVWIFLNVATAKRLEGNMFYGLAIGFAAAAMMYVFSGVSGGLFNPVVGLAYCLTGLEMWQNAWIFMAAPLIGGALSAIAFRFVYPDEHV